jgi:hypothetical protein
MTARPTRPTKIFTASAALCLTFGAALLASSLPVRAEDDEVPLDTKIMRSILEGIGLQRDGAGSTIDYGERSPLVIPPSQTLPPPENSSAAVANNPAWPKDPDVRRRKEYEKQAKKGVTSAEIDAWSRPLSPAEMTPGRNPNTSAPGIKASVPAGAEGQRLSPTELGYRGGLFDIFGSKRQEGTASFTGEPARTSLTEPPAGYQTPSAAQPYGEDKANFVPKAANATDERIEAATK